MVRHKRTNPEKTTKKQRWKATHVNAQLRASFSPGKFEYANEKDKYHAGVTLHELNSRENTVFYEPQLNYSGSPEFEQDDNDLAWPLEIRRKVINTMLTLVSKFRT